MKPGMQRSEASLKVETMPAEKLQKFQDWKVESKSEACQKSLLGMLVVAEL